MKLSVITPTWNNPYQLKMMVASMKRIGFFEKGDRELIIVNNGKQPHDSEYRGCENIHVLTCEHNRGWEGGLVEGLKIAQGKFVCFQNDDVHIPQNQYDFYEELIRVADTENAGMVGPITTTAAGAQSIFSVNSPKELTPVKWLIFFCVLMKRSTLDEVGGVDEMLPGGDDFDLSIRMNLAGKTNYINPKAFIVHHGFQTGNRVHGDADVDGGWNSRKMTERTNQALIRKHGFRNWFTTIAYQVKQ